MIERLIEGVKPKAEQASTNFKQKYIHHRFAPGKQFEHAFVLFFFKADEKYGKIVSVCVLETEKERNVVLE
ncbi:CLUMA_CG008802, isoform A [Clunio marinus]|uniref:CLUMA_CG008802, isoform A n=1 Tax=Clunio marinus TaxID=568069 RepID=A0A1J1I4Q3_9DIPT|nr:CLUMA_CG008802, isoform A [Clunio marinus]